MELNIQNPLPRIVAEACNARRFDGKARRRPGRGVQTRHKQSGSHKRKQGTAKRVIRPHAPQSSDLGLFQSSGTPGTFKERPFSFAPSFSKNGPARFTHSSGLG